MKIKCTGDVNDTQRKERERKDQMARSKWLVFNVIIASHCGKCLDISYENINVQPKSEHEKKEELANECTMHMH